MGVGRREAIGQALCWARTAAALGREGRGGPPRAVGVRLGPWPLPGRRVAARTARRRQDGASLPGRHVAARTARYETVPGMPTVRLELPTSWTFSISSYEATAIRLTPCTYLGRGKGEPSAVRSEPSVRSAY